MSAFQHFSFSPLSLLPLAGYWLVLIYNLGAQWSVYEQYNYGWAVPFLCLYLIWRRKQKAEGTGGKAEILKSETLKSLGQGAEGSGQRSVVSGRWAEFHLPSSIFYLLLAGCALLYAPTRFLHEANPIWRLTSLLWTLEVIGLTLLFVRWALGASPASQDSTIHHSLPPFQLSAFSFSDFVFPICFFLVAVPWPSGLENFLTESLMRLNTATTVELLGLFGVPAVQHGNVIEVSTGIVGIDEACSGIRSLQATLMLSLFFGEVYRLAVRRRLGLILLGFALAFLFNVGRTLLLTGVASAKGVGAVASWHDPAGVTILVACFLSLWLIARGFGGKAEKLKTQILKAEQMSNCASFSVSACQRFSIFLAAWLLLVETATEFWYRSHEHATVGSAEWSVQRPDQSSPYTEVPIPSAIAGQFRADEGRQAHWQDRSGNSWQLYYFRWLPARSLKKRVTIQLAKTHGPERCLPAVGMSLRSYLGIITVRLAGMELAMQQYVFNTEGRPLHVFYAIYEDPSGSTQLANRRKDSRSRVAAALAGSRNYGQRFLELAVLGFEKPEDARAALPRELGKLIKIEK